MATTSLHHTVLAPLDAHMRLHSFGPHSPPLAAPFTQPEHPPHLRHLSSQSEATLNSLNRQSYPTTDAHAVGDSSAYLGLLPRPSGQPRHTYGGSQRMSQDVVFGASPTPLRAPGERQSVWEHSLRQRVRRLRAAKGTLGLVVGVCGIPFVRTHRLIEPHRLMGNL